MVPCSLPHGYSDSGRSGKRHVRPDAMYGRRGETVAVRALCSFPDTAETIEEAGTQIRSRIQQPALFRDSEGVIHIYRPELG